MNTDSHDSNEFKEDEDNGPDTRGLIVSGIILAVFLALLMLGGSAEDSSLAIPFLVFEIALISVVIWQACDPFADAAQWIGETFRLPGSVRGATLDAIASSMPELFSGIFFVVLALSSVNGGDNQDAAMIAAGAEGYGSTIATCAGSAVYNMILIPAFCALVISYSRRERPTIDVEDEVISRDGLWFVSCEILLIFFLFQDQMMWWMGVVFLCLYLIYILQLYVDAKKYRVRMGALRGHFQEFGAEQSVGNVVGTMREAGVRVSPALVMKAQQKFTEDGLLEDTEGDADSEDSAGVFFGCFSVPMNFVTAWVVIAVSTVIAAAACYFLVEATLTTARTLQIPAFFVAVIVAAAASSVPDTFLAIGAARRGDDSGAVSNAFGSNIFDICICLSIPLLVNSYLTGWEPVSLLQDGKPLPGLMGLRLLLVVLTITNLAIMWHNRQITRLKACAMCGLYLIFIGYAVMGSLGYLF